MSFLSSRCASAVNLQPLSSSYTTVVFLQIVLARKRQAGALDESSGLPTPSTRSLLCNQPTCQRATARAGRAGVRLPLPSRHRSSRYGYALVCRRPGRRGLPADPASAGARPFCPAQVSATRGSRHPACDLRPEVALPDEGATGADRVDQPFIPQHAHGPPHGAARHDVQQLTRRVAHLRIVIQAYGQ